MRKGPKAAGFRNEDTGLGDGLIQWGALNGDRERALCKPRNSLNASFVLPFETVVYYGAQIASAIAQFRAQGTATCWLRLLGGDYGDRVHRNPGMD